MKPRNMMGPASYDVAAPVLDPDVGLLMVQLISPTTRYQARKSQARLGRVYPGAVVRRNRLVASGR